MSARTVGGKFLSEKSVVRRAGCPTLRGFRRVGFWKTITIDTLGLTFDALDRMVEQRNGSSYTEILYGPTGKLALMNGQSVVKAFIPLAAGKEGTA